MGRHTVPDQVDHALAHLVRATVLVLGGELSTQAQHDVSLPTPMIGPVPCGVLHHSDPKRSAFKSTGGCGTPLSGMCLNRHLIPIDRSEGQISKLHASTNTALEINVWPTDVDEARPRVQAHNDSGQQGGSGPPRWT